MNKSEIKEIEDFLTTKAGNYIKSIWQVKENVTLDKIFKRKFTFESANSIAMTWMGIYNDVSNENKKHPSHENQRKLEALNVFVMLTTLHYIKQNSLQVVDDKLIRVFYDDEKEKLEISNPRYNFTKAYVDESDWFDAYETLIKSSSEFNSKILILNNSNQIYPCGLWGKGGNGQEENITKRSNYFQYITMNCKHVYQNNHEKPWAAILSKKVSVFRGRQEEGYRFLPTINPVDILAVSSLDLEKTSNMDEHYKNMEKKIESIFKIGSCENYDVLVLGAFGCGRRRNDPVKISELFEKYLLSYRGHFKKIVFAINSKEDAKPFIKLFGSFENPKEFEVTTDSQKMEKEYIPNIQSICQNCKKQSSNIMISRICGHKLCLVCWNIGNLSYCPMVKCGKATGPNYLNAFTEENAFSNKNNVKCDFCQLTTFSSNCFILSCNHAICKSCRGPYSDSIKCATCFRLTLKTEIKIYDEIQSKGTLKCALCIDLKNDIWLSKKCGHTACKDCWSKYFDKEKNKQCPFCKIQVNYNEDLVRLIINNE